MTRRELTLLLHYLGRRRLIYLGGIASAAVGVVFLALNPILIRHLLNEVLVSGAGWPIALTILGIAGSQFVHRLLVIVNRIFRQLADLAMGHDIRRDLFARLIR